jgi:hypothetical protein
LILFELQLLDYPAEKIGNPVNVGKAAPADDAMALDKPPAGSTSAPSHAAPRPPAAVPKEMAAHLFPIEGLNPYHNKYYLRVERLDFF